MTNEWKHCSFSPLVFSTTGGMGTTATVVYKRLASMISEKHEKPYTAKQCSGSDAGWVQFSLLRSAVMCLRGSRSSWHHPDHHPIDRGSIDLVPNQDWTAHHLLWKYLESCLFLSTFVYFCLLFVSWIFNATEIRCKHQFLHCTVGLSHKKWKDARKYMRK